MTILGKRTVFEAGGIPSLLWLAVAVMAWNHLLLGFVRAAALIRWPEHAAVLHETLRPQPLPEGFWSALQWIVLGLFGKKVGDKWVGRIGAADSGGYDDIPAWNRGTCTERSDSDEAEASRGTRGD